LNYLVKVDVLQAEVDALKTLVITSTPSQPNPHLHPQLAQSSSTSSTGSNGSSVGPSTPPKSNGKFKVDPLFRPECHPLCWFQV
jgi:hypothetical protein